MRISKKKLIIVFFLSFLSVNVVNAGIHTGPIVPCGTATTPDCTLCHLWELGSNIINFITFNLSVSVAIMLFIVAGVFFLFSGGDESKVTRARNIMTNTVIGLLIIFTSWLLVDTTLKTLANGMTGPGFIIKYSWNAFPTCAPPPPPPS